MKKIIFLLFIAISCKSQVNMQQIFNINKDQVYTFANSEGKGIDSINTLRGQKFLYKEKVAIDNLITALKANGTWTKYNVIYTMAGGNWRSCGINYKDLRVDAQWVPNNHTNSIAALATNFSRKFGIKGDGFDFNINTFIPNSVYTQTNFSFGTYIIKPYKTIGTLISSFNTSYSNFFEQQQVIGYSSSTSIVFGSYSNTNAFSIYGDNVATPSYTGNGYHLSSRTSATSFKLYTPQDLGSTSFTTSNGGGNGGNIYLMTRAGLAYNTGAYNNSCIGAFTLANVGLTATEYANDKIAFDNFFNTLGVTIYGYSPYNNTKIVIDGDSQSSNTGGAGYRAWWIPDGTNLTGIQAALAPQLNTYTNVAVSGTTIGPASDGTSMLGRQAANVIPAYNSSLLHNVVVLWGGTNDICAGRTPADIFADIVTYVQNAKSTGFKVVVATILPRTQTLCGAVTGGYFESYRQSLNTLIRNNTQTYGYECADVASDENVGVSATASDNTTYYSDKVHLYQAGATVIFKYFHGAIMNLIY